MSTIKDELARIQKAHRDNKIAEGDWTPKEKRKAEIVALASDPRYPIGCGIEIPIRGDPIASVALGEAVLENPHLLQLVQQTDGRILLVKVPQFNSRVRTEFRGNLIGGGQIITADMLLAMKRAGTLDSLPGVHFNPMTDFDPVKDAAANAANEAAAVERAARFKREHGEAPPQVSVPAELEARVAALAEQVSTPVDAPQPSPIIVVKG